jgi:hypothetical protein
MCVASFSTSLPRRKVVLISDYAAVCCQPHQGPKTKAVGSPRLPPKSPRGRSGRPAWNASPKPAKQNRDSPSKVSKAGSARKQTAVFTCGSPTESICGLGDDLGCFKPIGTPSAQRRSEGLRRASYSVPSPAEPADNDEEASEVPTPTQCLTPREMTTTSPIHGVASSEAGRGSTGRSVVRTSARRASLMGEAAALLARSSELRCSMEQLVGRASSEEREWRSPATKPTFRPRASRDRHLLQLPDEERASPVADQQEVARHHTPFIIRIFNSVRARARALACMCVCARAGARVRSVLISSLTFLIRYLFRASQVQTHVLAVYV